MNIEDLVHAGTVVEVKTDKSLVKVDVLGRVTDWLPFLQQANSFKKQFVSVRVGQQVVVSANRYIIGSIFNADCLEPSPSDHIDISEYEDGTVIKYDTQAKELTIECVGDVKVKAVNAVIEAESVDVKSTNIKLNNGAGVVTKECICAYTGTPHSDASATVKAGK